MNTDISAPSDRRQFRRADFQTSAQVLLPDGARDAELVNISLDGALLEMASDLALGQGEPCQLRLDLVPGAESISMQATVCHTGPGRRVGLRRASIDCDSLTVLRRLLDLNAGDAELTKHELSRLAGAGRS